MAEAMGIHLVAVGITKAVDLTYIDNLATDASASFHVNHYSDLTSIVGNIVHEIHGSAREVCPSVVSKGMFTFSPTFL